MLSKQITAFRVLIVTYFDAIEEFMQQSNQHINVSYCHCTYKKNSTNVHQQLKKHALNAQFTYLHEKVILLRRSQLRALVVLVFAHDMQIEVPHALFKQGCRLISGTANKRLATLLRRVTIAPFSPTLAYPELSPSPKLPPSVLITNC